MGNCLFDSLNVYVRLASSAALRAALCDYVHAHREKFAEAIRFSNLDARVQDAADAAVTAAARQATQWIDAGVSLDDVRVKEVLARMVDLYLSRMRRNGVDGDHVMLAACALAYDMRIDVSWPRTGKHAFSEGRHDAPRLATISWVPGHYAAIAAAQPAPVTIQPKEVETKADAIRAVAPVQPVPTRSVRAISHLRPPPPPIHARQARLRATRVGPPLAAAAHHRHGCPQCQIRLARHLGAARALRPS